MDTTNSTSSKDVSDPMVRKRRRRVLFWIIGLTSFALLGFVAAALLVTGVRTVRVPSPAMSNTYGIGDILAVNLHAYRFSNPRHDDVIVFIPPSFALFPGQNSVQFISRIVGLPGDVVEIRNGKLHRNGREVEDKFAHFLVPTDIQARSNRQARPEEIELQEREFRLVRYQGDYWPLLIANGRPNAEYGRTAQKFMPESAEAEAELLRLQPVAIPEGHYIVMGDNRLNAYDSRSWGLVPNASIIGRVDRVAVRGSQVTN